MSEQCTTEEIIEKIRDIAEPHNKGKKVFDKDIADLLNIDKMNLASMKRRNTIPYEEIILFCDRCGLNPLEIIMKKKNC